MIFLFLCLFQFAQAANLSRIEFLNFDRLQELTQENFLHSNLNSFSSESLILNDEHHRISDVFQLNNYWRSRVLFWFRIYTQYDLQTQIVHDSENLNVVYDVYQTELPELDPLHPFVVENLVKSFRRIRLGEIKNKIKNLATNPEPTLNRVLKNGFGPEVLKNNKFKDRLLENMRVQSGQRSQIYSAILRFYPYTKLLPYFAEKFAIPKELIAIPFLESSFNPEAVSKVNAMGIWQIMPFIESKFLPKTQGVEYLKSVVLSSLVALELLKQNFAILKRWDLSVTAYNSGTKHLLKARQILKSSNLSLEDIFQNYKNPHLGFASQNFYAEFLAISHSLFYKEYIYPLEGIVDVDGVPSITPTDLHIYIAKCSINPTFLAKDNPSFTGLNTHLGSLFNQNKNIPKGTIVLSLIELPTQFLAPIPEEWWFTKIPKKWGLGITNYNCSTK